MNVHQKISNSVAFEKQGNLVAAVMELESIPPLQRSPDIKLRLAILKYRQGSFNQSGELLREMTMLKMDVPTSLAALDLLRSLSMHEEMLGVLERLPDPAGIQDGKLLQRTASHFAAIGYSSRALEYIDRAVELAPGVIAPQMSRSQIRMFNGDFDGAVEDLREFTRLAPDLGVGWWALARMRHGGDSASVTDFLRKKVAALKRKPPSDDLVYFASALHMELDVQQAHSEAFDALEISNQAKRRMINYDSRHITESMSRLAAPTHSPE